MARNGRTLELGVPAGRFLQLSNETNLPQPYEVTDKIIVAPPTKKSTQDMHDAQMRQVVYSALLNGALNRQPGQPAPTDEELNQLSKLVEEAELDYNKAFFGDAHDALMKFFEAQPRQLWDAFVVDIKKHFSPAPPPDGKCPQCGQIVDEEQAGKLPASST